MTTVGGPSVEAAPAPEQAAPKPVRDEPVDAPVIETASLLDEPTAGLDPSSSDDFCALVRELRAALGLTVIMVTHDLDTLFALSAGSVEFGSKRGRKTVSIVGADASA